jgi:hypothetical protein
MQAEKAAQEELRRRQEERDRLPEDEEAESLVELNEAISEADETKRAAKVAEVVQKQDGKYKVALSEAKKAAADRTKTAEEIQAKRDIATKELKKTVAIQAQIAKQEEKKEKAKQLAEAQAQEEEDRRNAVELSPTEKAELYGQISKITFVRPSSDRIKNIEQKKTAVSRAEDYAARLRGSMYRSREMMRVR